MHTNPERLAWRVMLTAFAIFLLLCSGLVYGIYWFIFRSYVPMDVTLSASRGTVQVTLPNSEEAIAVTDRRSGIEAGTAVQTDATAQGLLTLADPRTGGPVASVVLFRDTQVELSRAQAPRFGVNRSPYVIRVNSGIGQSDILILETNNDQTVSFELSSPQALIRSSGPGLYAIEVSEQDTQVVTHAGLAVVGGQEVERPVTLRRGERITVEAGRGTTGPRTRVQNLLTNSMFTEPLDDSWAFYNDREPPGTAYRIVFDGRPTVAIDRSQENWPEVSLGHGETGLVQFLELDVSQHDYLEMRATLNVTEQSLSTCGVAGSECPMMVHMVYVDASGVERVYIHGFYANHDPGLGYPSACATCRTEHERITPNTWYTFASGNLMTLLPNGQQPIYIHQVSFYASGHAYKVYVSEISLLAAE